MSTLQMCGQLLRPAQETGVEKEHSLASDQQTPNEQYPELSMSNGNSLNGSIGAEFSRLTEHLVFAFLGGYVSMDDLPCLGDMMNGIDEYYRTSSFSMNSYSESSQAESLDQNGNFHQLSAISMDLDFISRSMDYHCESVKISGCYQEPIENVSIMLDNFDSSSAACSPREHTSQRTDEIEPLPKNSMNANLICNKSVIHILNLDHPTLSMLFHQCDFTGKIVLSTIVTRSLFDSLDSNNDPDILFEKLAFKLQKMNRTTEIQEDALTNHHHALTCENLESQFHPYHKKLNDVPVSNLCPTTASKNRPINNENTFAIPKPGTLMDYLYRDLEIPQFLNTEYFSMQSESLCCTIGNDGEGPTFSVPDPSQLMNFLYGDLESPVFLASESIEEVVPIYAEYDGNDSKVEVISQSADHTIGEAHQCFAMQSPETIVDSNGFTNGIDLKRVRIPSSSKNDKENSKTSDSKLSYHPDEFNVVANYFDEFTSKSHNVPVTEVIRRFHENPTDLASNIKLSVYKNEDEEKMTTSNTDEPSLMNKNSTINSYGTPDIYVSSKCCDQKGCLLGDFYSDDDAEVEDLTGCMPGRLLTCDKDIFNTLNLPIESKNGSLIGAFKENEMTPTSSVSVGCNDEQIILDSSFFDLSDYADLLEFYAISNQDQYTDTGYSCESPSWPGKSEGQLQKSQTCLTPNLAEDDNANGISTADASLFPSNTDGIAVMNKKSTNKCYERNPENSVSLCQLNQMRCAFETFCFQNGAGSINCVHLCSDDSGDSIAHQSLKNDFKFAFPDPKTLTGYFFESRDSPRFLASELLDGKIDNLHYPSLFGGCELDHSTDEADLLDKMIFDQWCDVGSNKNDSSINKFSCSVEFPDVSSSSFDISDHDELLERYRIDNQDQFMDGNWTCDSPTWPGKI